MYSLSLIQATSASTPCTHRTPPLLRAEALPLATWLYASIDAEAETHSPSQKKIKNQPHERVLLRRGKMTGGDRQLGFVSPLQFPPQEWVMTCSPMPTCTLHIGTQTYNASTLLNVGVSESTEAVRDGAPEADPFVVSHSGFGAYQTRRLPLRPQRPPWTPFPLSIPRSWPAEPNEP
jgi:hypothetical protein